MESDDLQKYERDQEDAFEDLYGVSSELISQVREACDREDSEGIRILLLPLHVADQADLLQHLDEDDRNWIIDALADELDSELFSHLDASVREDIFENLETEQLADIVQDLDSDDAVELIEDLDEDEQLALLAAMDPSNRMLVESSLSYPDYTAGRIMRREVVMVPSAWAVGQTIDYMRNEEIELPDEFYNLIIVGPDLKPVGHILLSKILRTSRDVLIQDIMHDDLKVIPAIMDQEDVAFLFRQYALVEAPVVDEDGRLIGAITVDDIVEVIDEEHEDDILKMGGVREDDFYDDVIETTVSRSSWLLVNLATAILASLVISVFADALEKLVALAVLMPIVASMGGNAGTQTLTVAVRALATNELTASNALRIVGKETLVGGVNGLLFAVLMGGLAWYWFDDMMLGMVIALAMILNLIIAGMAGTLIPLVLDRMGQDPAISSSVFLTTITDVVGFFAFLGLATIVLL